MNFAYILHLLEIEVMRQHGRQYGLLPYVYMRSSLLRRLTRVPERHDVYITPQYRVKVRSAQPGLVCHGKIFFILMTPSEMLSQQTRAIDLIRRACRKAQDWGAEIIGLGGLTAIVGGMGASIQEAVDVPVTTGNAYTAYAALATFAKARAILGEAFPCDKPVLVGCPGSVATSIAEILVKQGHELIMVGRRENKPLWSFVQSLQQHYGREVEVCPELAHALKQSRVIISASTTGSKIDQGSLLPGTVVIDVAQPRDVLGTSPMRDDVCILDGEIITLPQENQPPFAFFPLGANHLYACLGEPILLAFEGRKESFSLGKKLDIRKVEEIGELAHKHGFSVAELFSFERPITSSAFMNVSAALRRSISSGPTERLPGVEGGKP